jgi:hypothetical protein
MLAFDSNTLAYRNNNMSSRGTPVRSYDRTWEEIEDMLNKAEAKRAEWKVWFEECRRNEDRDGMKEAARNHKALDGVVKTLKWALGEEGISNPLE